MRFATNESNMSLVAFDSLPDSARVWCFAAEPEPGPGETARLLDAMRAFLEEWTAHRAELIAALDWWHGRFLLVGLDVRKFVDTQEDGSYTKLDIVKKWCN